jgi:hypothetical protein
MTLSTALNIKFKNTPLRISPMKKPTSNPIAIHPCMPSFASNSSTKKAANKVRTPVNRPIVILMMPRRRPTRLSAMIVCHPRVLKRLITRLPASI